MKLWNSLADDELIDWCNDPRDSDSYRRRSLSRQPTARFRTQSRPCSFDIIPFPNQFNLRPPVDTASQTHGRILHLDEHTATNLPTMANNLKSRSLMACIAHQTSCLLCPFEVHMEP